LASTCAFVQTCAVLKNTEEERGRREKGRCTIRDRTPQGEELRVWEEDSSQAFFFFF
jgi:hypothetical protein